MEPVVGVICEYDPFHRGHARQFALIRERLPGARIVCLMSGCVTQRGQTALFAPSLRAQAALHAGADLVLELPCAYAVRDAERFARGGVRLLSALGFVTHLSFGMEHDALPLLLQAAALCEQPTDEYRAALRAGLDAGLSFAGAQGAALAQLLNAEAAACGVEASAVFASPNDVLGLCYLRAIRRLRSPLLPLPLKREGDYHADALTPWPSAGAVRKAFRGGRVAEAEQACGYPLEGAAYCRAETLDPVLLHTLRSMTARQLAALPDCTEGLEKRVEAVARRATDRETLLSALKTRRYPYARLQRLMAHALLGFTAELAEREPDYVRLLGFRADSPLMPRLRQSGVRVIAKAADGDRDDPLYRLDARAYDLWALGAGLPAGEMFRAPVLRG